MDFIKSQFDRIQQQLSGLSASQKMLTAALVAIMVMTLVWWGRYAGVAEMAPVLDQSFSDEDITRITAQLASKRIDYRVAGDKVLIPVDRKFEVLADLSYSQLLPRDTRGGFDEIVKQISPWASASERDAMYNRAKEQTLSHVISGYPNVAQASVMINAVMKRQISGNIEPSASIDIKTRGGGGASKRLVEAAADVVAGAVAGLKRSKIHVVIDGASHRVRGNDVNGFGGDIADEQIDRMQAHERYLKEKIEEHLSYIQGVMVSVTVDVNLESSQKQTKVYDPKNTISKEVETRTRSVENSSSAPPPFEPGPGSNIQMRVDGAGNGDTSSIETEEEARFEILSSSTQETTLSPAGGGKVVAASVRVPRSYFVGAYKLAKADAKDPDEATLKAFIDLQLPGIRSAVKSCTGLRDDELISVESYPDVVPLLAAAVGATGAPAASATAPLTETVRGYSKEIAVGLLAVVSLFLVSSMVRKGTPAPVAVVAAPAGPPPVLEAGEVVAGEVGEGSPLLDGMELDQDAVRTQQMLDQVSTMVKENPDGAANLVKRWLNRS